MTGLIIVFKVKNVCIMYVTQNVWKTLSLWKSPLPAKDQKERGWICKCCQNSWNVTCYCIQLIVGKAGALNLQAIQPSYVFCAAHVHFCNIPIVSPCAVVKMIYLVSENTFLLLLSLGCLAVTMAVSNC
jgi:hypothetical protein